MTDPIMKRWRGALLDICARLRRERAALDCPCDYIERDDATRRLKQTQAALRDWRRAR